MPPFDIRFRRFTSLNTTIRCVKAVSTSVSQTCLRRLRRAFIRPSRTSCLRSSTVNRLSAPTSDRYRRHVSSEAVSRQAEQIRQTRGRKRILTSKGHYYDLDEIFERLNFRFFHGLMGRPILTWSEHHARRLLGHYDAAHNTIMVSRIFDRADVPLCAIEYLLYHEMLHLKHPVRMKGTRRCVHSREFQADERLFPELDAAKAYLKRL